MQDLLCICSICGNSFPSHDLVSGELVRKEIVKEIKQTCKNWNEGQFICIADLATMRSRYVHSLLMSEKNELTSLEQTVIDNLRKQELLSIDIEEKFDNKWTFGERLTDKIARFGGSWWFLISFAIFLTLWIVTNSLASWRTPSDPYPFIFLNLLLSCIAAIQAPVIMMSQNRQEAKDRMRSQHDYQINLKAELEIRSLHEKIDHLLSQQWEKMTKIQEIQLELLSELHKSKKTGAVPDLIN
ncbi:DUF1003 domain-containing protein [Legionella maioricensis]|uniref:DUF1003 domain-containing protein n=1 Tax=Legionella maioricensis TaxID=2896528 RepID=A0A9X2CZX0_9GAMM|nr:DUF1003 domain-containing protein [Legionella maioricensis]MCL9683848.1 DUF1003 domain-containing protein [Legionella maioricensis]MCL9686695.1 DUF1003 domain-containing protein [Legionella maioricensis]